MKTIYKITFIASIVFVLGITLPNFWLEFDDFGIFLCDRWFDSHYTCNRIWLDPDCNRPGSGCIFPEKSPYEQFLEKKATMVFNLKLDDYRITSEVQDVHKSYSTGIYKSFLGIVDGKNSTQYYLTTVFDPDESLDNIDVKIYEIISDKCNRELVYKGNGCELKYLKKIEQPIRSSLDYGWIAMESEFDSNSVPMWKIPEELSKIGCTGTMVDHLKKYSNAFDEKWHGKDVAIEGIGLPWGVHQYALDQCMQNISELRNNELYGCTENEVYFSGICMTPEIKERSLTIGEKENEN